jgi:hypothetical protein
LLFGSGGAGGGGPQLLFGVMFGLAVLFRRAFVAAMSLLRLGTACHRSATTPTTCGPAIEVPLKGPKAESLEPIAERVDVPGATMSGLIRLEPSTVTGPRLLKPTTEFVPVVSAPVEYDAA